jgi:hypothetical protein
MTRPTGVTKRPLSAVHGQQSIYMRLTHLGRLDLVSALDPVKVEAETIRPSVTAALDEAGAKILRAIAAYESAEQPISSEPTVLWQEFIDD